MKTFYLGAMLLAAVAAFSSVSQACDLCDAGIPTAHYGYVTTTQTYEADRLITQVEPVTGYNLRLVERIQTPVVQDVPVQAYARGRAAYADSSSGTTTTTTTTTTTNAQTAMAPARLSYQAAQVQPGEVVAAVVPKYRVLTYANTVPLAAVTPTYIEETTYVPISPAASFSYASYGRGFNNCAPLAARRFSSQTHVQHFNAAPAARVQVNTRSGLFGLRNRTNVRVN